MLLNLHVKNLAIIDEVEVFFSDHLNILTGETGAGKSIIIGSINIALGGKVSKDIIRKGADYALVELVFQLEDEQTINKIRQMDLSVDDGQIIISRKIMNGRSLSKVNGEIVTAALLQEIAGLLIDIHGQHEHQSLLYKSKHLVIVDRYAKDQIVSLKKDISDCYHQYTTITKEIEESFISEDQRLRQLSFLEYEINEIENARLIEGEEEQLFSRHKKLSNANTMMEGLSNVYDLTGGLSDSIGEQLSRAVRVLNKLEDLDDDVSSFSSQLNDIENLTNDFNRELADYLSNLNYDQEDFIVVEERMSLIHNLKAKYGNTISQIQEYYENGVEKLNQYKDYDQYMTKLVDDSKKVEAKLLELSTTLSNIRKDNAKKLSEQIMIALKELNFLSVEFEINFKKLDRYSEQGYDEVEFLISTNPGEDLKPLSKVASGGELSRIMLAIKSVMADNDAIDTLIFDEIDVGVSGRTAQKVSERLSVIAKNHQVLCITHLPQIAAMADSHYIIEKSSNQDTTTTTIYRLDEESSVQELARILGGAKITESVIKNAKEMKELASNTKLF